MLLVDIWLAVNPEGGNGTVTVLTILLAVAVNTPLSLYDFTLNQYVVSPNNPV